ncbi:hypothetical protein [Ferruginibacter sp. HRS2-29]|uniref:hypothetical protein n=1 Tax=Ferruginibacter sp. HRS2-29 TaxID=2487334 RepID=UPI0020CBF6E6|nr:hypothetical protein [Ferruginibacter sp. HRS2-29]MCP9752925.1 hypothetical protein [Ferruginibacter sp. HRS2-29]
MKKSAYILLFSCLILFQSCFEIIEQVFIKNDGSGNFQLVINLSKSKTRVNSIMKMKTVNGHDVPTKAEITEKVAAIEKTIAGTAGISNVKTNLDFTNYIATLTCDFSKVAQLNTVVKNINDKEKGKQKTEKSFDLDAATNVFSRLNKFQFKEDYNKMSNADKEIFSGANYTAIYKFEKPVSLVSNKDANISPSKKAVMLKLNVLDIITNKKSIENKITITK